MFDLRLAKPIPTQTMRKKLIERVLTHSEHRWILEDQTYSRAFIELLSALPTKALQYFYQAKPILFIRANGSLACTVHSMAQTDIVICYPDLLALLKKVDPERGLAVLAHELGHLFNQHSKKKISSLDAQYEADQLAIQSGFKDGLLELLESKQNIEECRLRIEKILNENT